MDMNNNMGLRVGNAHNRINNLRETWQIFLDHLKQNTDLDSVPSNINVDDEVISVDCFGKQVSAYPLLFRMETVDLQSSMCFTPMKMRAAKRSGDSISRPMVNLSTPLIRRALSVILITDMPQKIFASTY
jgi:hypothetical protein